MVRHVVMFQIKATDRSKEENMQLLVERLKALKDLVPEIRALEVGANQKEGAHSRDVVLNVDFDDFEALERYIVHPEHVKVVGLLKEIREDFGLSVDYEY